MADAQFDPSKPFTAAPTAVAAFDPAKPFEHAQEAHMGAASPDTALPAPTGGHFEDKGGQVGKVWIPDSHGGEVTRQDNSLFGMPPEFAALAGLQVGKAIGNTALSAAGRAVAALKTTAAQVTPVLKYEATKTTLEKLGVPSSLATMAAVVVAGYKRGAKGVATAAEETASVSPTAAPPASVTAAPVVAASQPFVMSKALETAKSTFDTLGVKPGPAEISNAASMMKFGKTAEEAVARVIAQRPTPPLSAVERLAAKPGMVSNEDVAARVAERNRTGRWPK